MSTPADLRSRFAADWNRSGYRLHPQQFKTRWEAAERMGQVREYDRKGRTYWSLRFSFDGVRYEIYNHKGVRFESREHAERVLHQIQGKLAEATDPVRALAEFLPARSKPNRVLERMGEYLAELEERVTLGELSPHTVANFRRWVRPPEAEPASGGPPRRKRPGPRRRPGSDYYAWWAGYSLHEVRTAHVRRFRRHLEAEGLGPDSVRAILERLGSFLTWALGEELIERVPEIELPARAERRPKLLLGAQRRRVLEAIAPERRGIFLLLSLGQRPGTARAVLVEDVSDGFIRVHRAVKSHLADGPVGPTKAKREGWVPLTRDLAAWISEFGATRHPKARLFYNPAADPRRNPGKRWTHRALWLEWKAACARAGVPYVPLYQGTKHSFATERLLAGKSKDAVAEFMHISRHQVDTYARWARELSAEVLDPSELAGEAKVMLLGVREEKPKGGNGGGTP